MMIMQHVSSITMIQFLVILHLAKGALFINNYVSNKSKSTYKQSSNPNNMDVHPVVFDDHETSNTCSYNAYNIFSINNKIGGCPSRRTFLASSFTKIGMLTSAPLVLLSNTNPSFATEDSTENGEVQANNFKTEKESTSRSRSFVKGKVILQPGTEIPNDISKSALYITARPNNAVNVPRAILDGSNGKPPPVLAARFPNVDFPYSFELTVSDLTTEGNALISRGEELDSKYWWEGNDHDLIISARFDTDGVAATRDPSDLVGRDIFVAGAENDVSIQLQGRGVAGKFFTSKSK